MGVIESVLSERSRKKIIRILAMAGAKIVEDPIQGETEIELAKKRYDIDLVKEFDDAYQCASRKTRKKK
jgi:hypothetical protein